jgi:cysteine desulfurase
MGMNEHIYLDFNASTPLRPGVMTAMTEVMQHYGNPSSIHKFGRAARARIESARDILAEHLEVQPTQVVFTSGGTEANNLIIQAAEKQGCTILMSAIEHESVEHSAPKALKIPVQADGLIDLAVLEKMLSPYMDSKLLVSVMLANNETGVIQPIVEIAKLVHEYGGKLHCDGVPAFTKLPFSYKSLNADYLTISAHKIGGPKGCGAIVLPLDEQLPSLIHGGGQEKGHRAGTENILGIVGFAKALEDSREDNWSEIEKLRHDLEDLIAKEHPDAPIYGKNSPRLPNTSYLGMPGIPTQTQLMAFDLEGFAVSSGSACSSGKIAPSHVLKAMGYNDNQASEAIRVSLGWTTTKQQIEDFARAWLALYTRNRTNR